MTDDTHVLDDAREAVYERSGTHGEPEDNFATIGRMWGSYLSSKYDQLPLSLDEPDVVNMMILLKVARNADGVYNDDNYTDIAGYAENGARVSRGDEQ